MEVISHAEKAVVNDDLEYDHVKEMESFIETKAGVKGLVDPGVVKVPRIFIHRPDNMSKSSSNSEVPVIDLKGLESGRRPEIVKAIHDADQTWGFFQMINHGVPDGVMNELLACIHRFHEQPKEVKLEYYSRDTRLHRDNMGGLQILHDNHWVDVPHLWGSLVVNIGDFMQLISNDKFKSVMHRALAGSVGNRVSASCFFLTVSSNREKVYGPATELLSAD